jgi:putative ABC transport system permease protein
VVVNEVGRLPGVLAAEPYRDLPVRIRKDNIERRLMITGRPATTDLNRIIDVNLRPVELPESGLAISGILAEILGVRVGDPVEVDLLEGQRRTIILPISALIEDYFGIKAIMNAEALAHILREAPTVTSVQISLDETRLGFLYTALKRLPMVAGLALQSASLANFRKSLAIIVTLTASIYTGLAAVIAFGVVYNSARISLSERARELASLRVLGFTRGEVLWILLLELALLAALAQPVGWAIGYGLAWVMRNNLAGELMRVRLVVEPFTYLLASGIVLTAAALSALVIRDRVRNLDLISVLKTRD